MANITITDLTNKTENTSGTGTFDVILETVRMHLEKEYVDGRITGTDYANVYLGLIQSVLSEAIRFLMQKQEADKKAELLQSQILSENKNNEPGGVIDLEKQKLQEEIDLVIAKTADTYANIDATRAGVAREDSLAKQKVAQINAEIALLNAKEAEELAMTIRQNNESVEKVLLMKAQTLGFKTDLKQKMLKQMMDGYSVIYSISKTPGVVPLSIKSAAIDSLANEMLDDVGSQVNI